MASVWKQMNFFDRGLDKRLSFYRSIYIASVHVTPGFS